MTGTFWAKVRMSVVHEKSKEKMCFTAVEVWSKKRGTQVYRAEGTDLESYTNEVRAHVLKPTGASAGFF